MPRLYTASIDGQSITNANGDYELLEIDAAAGKPVELRSIVLKTTSELQEAQEEWLRIQVIRGHTTDGTGGTSVTPRPLSPADAAAGFTADLARTAIASSGTAVTLWSDAFNVRAGYELFRAPLEGFWTSEADLLVVRLTTAVTDDVTMSLNFEVCEYP